MFYLHIYTIWKMVLFIYLFIEMVFVTCHVALHVT